MGSDMPEWLIEYLEENTGFKRPGYFGYPYYTTTKQSDAVVEFYEFISKPENAAKLSCVESLIDEIKAYLNYSESCGYDKFVHSEYQPEQDIHKGFKQVIKPFKKEGE